jgi:hypothetical protein
LSVRKLALRAVTHLEVEIDLLVGLQKVASVRNCTGMEFGIGSIDTLAESLPCPPGTVGPRDLMALASSATRCPASSCTHCRLLRR